MKQAIAILLLILSAMSYAETSPVAKDRLVLMPLRTSDEDKILIGAMEAALVEGLQSKYEVLAGEGVAQKAHEVFMKESRNTAHIECDETRCMQDIAEAFQSELIAVANISKKDGSYFLALSIQNIFDNKVVLSRSLPCENCNSVQVIAKLKELSGTTRLVGKAVSLHNKYGYFIFSGTTTARLLEGTAVLVVTQNNHKVPARISKAIDGNYSAVVSGDMSSIQVGDSIIIEENLP